MAYNRMHTASISLLNIDDPQSDNCDDPKKFRLGAAPRAGFHAKWPFFEKRSGRI